MKAIVIFGYFLAFLGINIYFTQYTAQSFGYASELGASIGGFYLNPFSWAIWSIDLSPLDTQNGLFFKDLHIKVAFSFLALLATFPLMKKLFFGRRAKAYDDVHGSAKWATKDEIDTMGVLNNSEGVYIGGWQDPKTKDTHYLRHNGPEHIMAFAPTRSGKGVGLVVPTLLTWKESTIVLDIKGENWALTSGWRQSQGHKVLKFDPTATDGSSVKFNPLEEINLGSQTEVGEVQNVAMMIVDPNGKGLNDYWAKAGFSILVAFILHTLYKAKNENFSPTLSSIYEIINDKNKNIREVLDEMMNYPHIEGNPHSVVATAAREVQNKADAELSGVIATMSSNLGLYSDPIIASNLEYSEFKIKDIMNHDVPVSLYLVIKPREIDRMRPLVRIVINQILRTLIDDMQFADGGSVQGYKHRLLLMLDEFTSLGKLEIFEQALAYMAGYGIKSYIIVQDLMQLYKHYTKEESIISNSHVRVAYAPNKVETAELLSKMSGTTTVVKTVRTLSGKRSGMSLNNISENYQEVQRPLLTVDECMTLPGMKKDNNGNVSESGDMLIFTAGNSAIYGKQILYFRDSEFLQRAKIVAPIKSDSLITATQSNTKQQILARPDKERKSNETLSAKRKKQKSQSMKIS